MADLVSQIQFARVDKGWSGTRLALEVKMTQQAYSRFEYGTPKNPVPNPTMKTLMTVANGLDAEFVLVPKDKLAAVKKILDR